MLKIIKKLEKTFADRDLIELNDENAETISGGYELFTIKNQTNYNVGYSVDGKVWKHKPNYIWRWLTFGKGIINFDTDGRLGVESYKKYNLSSGKTYAFRDNKSTSDPYDIELYDIT